MRFCQGGFPHLNFQVCGWSVWARFNDRDYVVDRLKQPPLVGIKLYIRIFEKVFIPTTFPSIGSSQKISVV
ncbi:hypothetical protein NAS141_04573 [Sulfitobacter sp. NAS-14.1]|nr:hypothetical protein NAS141_04573 [Sulfitobacter sp. NAS-14.1]